MNIENLKSVVNIATTFNIDDLIIETNGDSKVRGINTERNVVLLSTVDLNLPKNTLLAISPTYQLKDYLNLFDDRCEIDLTVKGEIIRQIQMSNETTKITFNGSNPVTIKAPKKVKDQEVATIEIDKDKISIIERGYRAISSKQTQKPTINLIIRKNNPIIKVINHRNDSIEIDQPFKLTNDVSNEFVFKYPAEYFLKSITNKEIDNTIVIGEKGTAKFIYKQSLSYYILPIL